MASTENSALYEPLDVLKPVASGIWIVDSEHRMMGVTLPVRMTVVRLSSGDMWLHSPTRFAPALAAEIEAIGPVRHLVAPNIAHWSFLKDWHERYPAAQSWAAPGLETRRQVKQAGVRLDRVLAAEPPEIWAEDLDQVLVPGGAGVTEMGFFHRPSRTLMLVDLIQNFEPEKLPAPLRLATWLVGSSAPDGKAPVYLRWIVRRKHAAAGRAARRMVEWAPERVIFAHGDWFAQDGTTRLRQSLRWLLD
jgi:hypothetical protein